MRNRIYNAPSRKLYASVLCYDNSQRVNAVIIMLCPSPSSAAPVRLPACKHIERAFPFVPHFPLRRESRLVWQPLPFLIGIYDSDVQRKSYFMNEPRKRQEFHARFSAPVDGASAVVVAEAWLGCVCVCVE